MADQAQFIARESDVAVLNKLWDTVRSGTTKTLRLQAPFGGGRRAIVAEFLNAVEKSADDTIVWRVVCLDQENGLQWLVRMYGSLVATLTADAGRRGRIEMALNAALPSQPKRVQGWYQSFVTALKEAEHDASKGQIKLQLPKDNPLIGLVEAVVAISKKFPIVLDLQGVYTVNSLMAPAFLEAVLKEGAEQGARIFTIVHDEPESDVTKSLFPMPLLDWFEREKAKVDVHLIPTWGTDETTRFLTSRSLPTTNAARIAEIAGGRPGYISELVEILTETNQLDGDISAISFSSLVPVKPDESELDVPEVEPEEGKRKHATAADAPRIAYFAALLGQAFPSSLVADMGGFERESVDDLVDAMGDLFEEMQYQQDLGTWIYKFKRGSWREGILEQNATEEGKELARRVGLFMERFLVPRGYGFIVKTARIYAENAAPGRANLMRSVALSNDAPDAWGLTYDFGNYFDELGWPDPMWRTVYMNLLDRMVAGGPMEATEKLYNDVQTWSSKKDDREMTAWLLFAGSRLDARRQDLYRSRDRARDSLKLYEALGNKARCAEILNHLASVELQDGNPNAALELIQQALAAGSVQAENGQNGVIPGILATAEFLRGQILRRAGKVPEASEHFRRANEVAGNIGQATLALDAGLGYGETLLAQGNTQNAQQVLKRVLQIAQQLGNPVRERNASELLAQAEGALKNYEAATNLAARTLELSQKLKFEQALPIDLYNLGFFHYANSKPAEALRFFKESAKRVSSLPQGHPVIKELYYYMGMAGLRTGQLDDAKKSLQSALRPVQAAKDWKKMVASLDGLAVIEARMGNRDVAKKLIADAIGFAHKAGLKDEKRSLKKRLDELEAQA